MPVNKQDLYEYAKLFFPADAQAYPLQVFLHKDKLQFVAGAALNAFIDGDHFFKFFGDQPMPSYVPYGWFDVFKVAWSGLRPETLEARIKSNAILRTTVGRTYRPWWQNPEIF
jgi:hypothetical protein